ncbi:MAG: DoxX family membrane protein [Pseudonocardiales bacterium]|nr:DoxX family membrane protein [Pseudonocardiales bacterium]
MPDTRTQSVATGTAHSLYAKGFAALRIFTGFVWLSNALAKIFNIPGIDLGFFSGNLITLGAAKGIATGASSKTQIAPLGAFYRDVVLPNWGFFGTFLTIAELAVGLGLIFGVASRLAAVGGLLLIGPIWVMLWHTNLYLWEYPAEDLFPLLLLAIAPAGRVAGLDARLAAWFGGRWPF